MMQRRKRFFLLLIVGLISLFAIRTILAQDNNGHGNSGGNNGNGNGNGGNSAAVQPNQNGDNGNHHGGGNDGSGVGNGGSNASAQPTQNGDNGNHHGGGNNGSGVGNGGSNNSDNQNNSDTTQNTDTSTVQQQSAPIEQVQATSVPQETDGLLGCQKNNPSRLDCSSLEVKGICDGATAQFIIHNTGEPGAGDMRAPTQYRLLVDGVVVEVGSVQLAGGASGLVTYSGGGSVTLEVDQQVGHPGNSHPRVTLDCGPASTETAEPTEEFTPTPTPTETLTPTVTAPDLSGEAICKEDGSVVFVITNNGGDMLNAAGYTVVDMGSNSVDSGNLQLAAGEQNFFQYWVNTGLVFTVGDLVVISDPTCAPSTPEVTPTSTPDVTPTVEPTLGPDLSGQSYCQMDGTILFVIYNYGTDMLDPEYYTVTNSNGVQVSEGYAQVMVGEPFPLYFAGYPSLTFTMGSLVINSPKCGPDITPEPTVDVTPPVDDSILVGSVSCLDDGSILFVITNNGGDMPEPTYYSVTDTNGALAADGYLVLMAGQSTSLQYFGYTRLTFSMGALVITQDAECIPPTPEVTPTVEPTAEVSPTPEPTQEVTPTAEPTQEVTPTAEPTDEVTPTVEPTQTFTPTPTQTGTLGCQKNNPDRKDCSSLQVTATCQDGVAVFTVRNTGKAGEGDMISSTQYRIIVDGVVVETGTVQLTGGSSTQITYSGTGSITLEADQQTGHPGGSQPQATVNCSA